MARMISFGTPVNDAERWAFSLLADELPEDYILLTNVEIPTKSGQAMEVDALVIGEWGVYVVDVKGYIGRLDAGLHAWSLDGREVDNSLAKANYVARVLAGNVKHKIPVGVYAPWCQGMVFVTGRKGEEIELEKQQGSLSIYTPKQIVAALTTEWGLTAPKKHQVTETQKELVLETIGQVAIVEQRNNKIQDFTKLKCLFIQSGLEVWQAEYNPGEWTAPWLLKVLIPTQFNDSEQSEAHEAQLRREFLRLQSLSGCCGVPYCAPLIQDGEQLVLPIRMPRGVPLNVLESEQKTTYQLLEILRRSVTGLQQIHRRGFTVGGWTSNCIFVSDMGDVEFIDIKDSVSTSEDIKAYAEGFLAIAEQTQQPRIYQWYREAVVGSTTDLDALRSDLSALIDHGVCDTVPEKVEITAGAIVDHHFKLEQFIAATESSQFWRATHMQGQYQCGMSIYSKVEANWPMLSNTYRSLAKVYHPHIEKVLAFGQLPQSEKLFIARAWEYGVSIDELEEIQLGQPLMWFTQLLTGLQYMHQMDIYHGAICPKNIICNPNKAILVNFGIGLDIAASHYACQYADPTLWEVEGDAEKDLYGLVASFIDAMAPDSLKGDLCQQGMIKALEAFDREWFGEALYDVCYKVLNFDLSVHSGMNYLEMFDLADKEII
ncbi:NERD domain-containing serine/threonine-protein kinase [Shewanella schlegeliana]|uniref:NERD domain-containing protein n=1 Tax=Shewanella schlegeliana TaxID=190308 RepID=A0ABS1SYW7_9GAMM|nr:NERD domain-containing protein kinase family protein [Shewanella schlegeliana]MBL4913205.1 NERD domain-containing protein [Shewanella schlegeliana]MCL1109160.1 NERD domain-containing serine/threonine-protein kinase [Shewanella schlegeliana]GIU24151.1 serine/threonine protein kinase [Shewanella schlegeliana]